MTAGVFEGAVGLTFGTTTAPVVTVTDWLGNVYYPAGQPPIDPGGPPVGGGTDTGNTTPPATSPDVTAFSSTPNSIRRLSVRWATPTTGQVRITRTAGGIEHTENPPSTSPLIAASVGQSTDGAEFSEAYLDTATQVVVKIEPVFSDGSYGPAATVTVPLSAAPAPNPVPARRTDLTRDPRFHPFTATSPWNLPLPTSPAWEAVDSPATVSLRADKAGSQPNKGWHASQLADSHPVNHALASDPTVAATDTVFSGRSRSFKAPLGTLVSDDTSPTYHDKHSHVVQPDGVTVAENFHATRYTATRWNVRRHHTVSMTGDGLGPQNGTRAYGGSALGGLIRAHEVEAKVIPHAIAWLFRSDQILRLNNPGGNYGYYESGTFTTRDRSVADWCPDGWPLGTPRVGFSKGRGYQWPATEQDYVIDNLTGSLPYGAQFGIPGDVDLASLGLVSEAGLILAVAMQTYGGIFSDQGGDAGIQIETQAPTWFRTQLIDSFKSTDIRKIIQACRVVSGNSPSTPGGQPIAASRRAPLVPEIGPATVTDTTAPTTTLTSPSAGSTTQRTFTAQGGFVDN